MNMKGLGDPMKVARDLAETAAVTPDRVPARRTGFSMPGIAGAPTARSLTSTAPPADKPAWPERSPDPAPAKRMIELARAIRIELLDDLGMPLRKQHKTALAEMHEVSELAARRERFAAWGRSSSPYAKEAAKANADTSVSARSIAIEALTRQTEACLARSGTPEEKIPLLESMVTKIHDLLDQRGHLVEPPFSQAFGFGEVLVASGAVLATAAAIGLASGGSVLALLILGVPGLILAAFFAVDVTGWRRKLRDLRAQRQRIDQDVNELRAEIQRYLDAWLADSRPRGELQRDAAKAKLERLRSESSALLATSLRPLMAAVTELEESTGLVSSNWSDPRWDAWSPAVETAPAVRFGALRFQLTDLEGLSTGVAPPNEMRLPALLSWRNGRGILFTTGESRRTTVIATIQGMITRLLATMPPGRLYFTFIDPVGSGNHVGIFMGLRDHLDRLVNIKAWSEPTDIEQRLGELLEQLEEIIQRRIPDPKESIEEYNARAGTLAEPYRVVVVLDFPRNLNDTAIRRLVSLAQNGPRCGFYPILMRNAGLELPYRFDLAELERNMVCIDEHSGVFTWRDALLSRADLELDMAAPTSLTATIVHEFGSLAAGAEVVEIPFPQLLRKAELPPDRWWTGSGVNGIRIPLGIDGNGKIVALAIDKEEPTGSAQHALLAGATGMGKSNLLHVIVSGAAIVYPPDELQLWLVDLRAGVEFNNYARLGLPHARVIAVDDDPDYAMSVLEGVDEERKRRDDLFTAAGVNNYRAYRLETGRPLPRILVIIDEFQGLFPNDHPALANKARGLLDTLARQARGPGIHLLLCSQNIGRGDATLHAHTADQMAIRIALRSSPTDAMRLLGDDNLLPTRFNRKGQALYNPNFGNKKDNREFQAALLNVKEDIDSIRRFLATKRDDPRVRDRSPRVFMGADAASLPACEPLTALLRADRWPSPPRPALAWLGEPIAMRPPLAIDLSRESGRNLLVVTRDEGEAMGMLLSAMLSIAAQQGPDQAEFYLLDQVTRDKTWAAIPESLAEAMPHPIRVTNSTAILDQLESLLALLQERQAHGRALPPTVYLVLFGLHRARRLHEGGDYISRDDEGDPRNQLLLLLRDGPELGIHTLAWCDSTASVQRIGRAAAAEFRLRVAGSMNDTDSIQFIDSNAAARLKPNRVVYANLDDTSSLTQFRPYALPGTDWLGPTLARLKARAST